DLLLRFDPLKGTELAEWREHAYNCQTYCLCKRHFASCRPLQQICYSDQSLIMPNPNGLSQIRYDEHPTVATAQVPYLYMVSEPGSSPFRLPVHAPVEPGHEGWVRVPHWLGNGLAVCLYGLEQSSPHELAFGVELEQVSYLYNI
ncbi:hypothetical protein HAX54_020599, partial [Datura stramonium]|nr:hypothetical protein [Datura stramonium]